MSGNDHFIGKNILSASPASYKVGDQCCNTQCDRAGTVRRTAVRRRACDLLVKGDLRPVLAQYAQNLLASGLQTPPVPAAHKPKQSLVRPFQGL